MFVISTIEISNKRENDVVFSIERFTIFYVIVFKDILIYNLLISDSKTGLIILCYVRTFAVYKISHRAEKFRNFRIDDPQMMK